MIWSPDGSQRIPLEAVDALTLFGGAQITTQALDACVRRGVRVASLQRSGKIRFVVSGQTSGNVHLRSAQFQASFHQPSALELSRTIVAAKIQNSSKVVSRWARDAKDPETKAQLKERASWILERIPRLEDADTGDKVRGIEGDCARIYFRAVARVLSTTALQFSARSRRPPRDPVNALLSFCYSMLVTEYIGAAESVGLDFQVGFLHRQRSGRPSLALDLAEELRAMTDRFVVTLVRRRQVKADCFKKMPGGAVYLNDAGRKRLLGAWEQHKGTEVQHQILGRQVERWALPSVQATLLARHLRGDLKSYPPFVMA